MSAPRCSVCRHESRWRIEQLRAAGGSLESLARKFGLKKSALHRHWRNHVTPEARAGYLAGPANLAQLAEKAAEESGSVLDYLKACRGALLQQLASMQEAGDARAVAYVVDKLRAVLETYAKVSGELATLAGASITNNTQVFVSPSIFADLQGMLVRALQPYPEALSRVVEGLSELERRSGHPPAHAPTPVMIEHGSSAHA